MITSIKLLAKMLRRKAVGYSIAFAAIAIFIILIKYGLDLDWTQVGALIGTGLTAMTPLVFAAVGECINERAGTINIGLEGIFLFAALIGVYGAELLRSWAGGLLFATLIGAFIGLIFGLICVYLRADQIIAGMALNIFAAGMIAYLMMAIWRQAGQYTPIAKETFMPMVSTPLGSLSFLTFVAVGVAILAHVLLHRTLLGIKIRAAGEKPESADVAGVQVNYIRILTCVLGASLCAIGGAFMSLSWIHAITNDMVAGYGFIALACVVFAGLEPLLVLIPAFLFGLGRALAPWAGITPAVRGIFPGMTYFLRMIPFILVLIALVIVGKKLFPRALGKPYTRE
jgi:simple sugar transport system permease protein